MRTKIIIPRIEIIIILRISINQEFGYFYMNEREKITQNLNQYQTIVNLYESNINPEIIAWQIDGKIDDVLRIINNFNIENKKKNESIMEASKIPKLGMIFVDPIFDIEKAIEDTQTRIWSNLKVQLKFDIPFDNTQELLEKFTQTNVVLVILCVDLVGSTELSMNLPLKRLVPIIQAFTQEMSLIIQSYGGYVFKYVGDAIMAFFFTEKNDLYLPCVNSLNCGHSMIRIVKEGINPILEEYGYPELGVRVGIDIGENAVVQYGLRPEITTRTAIKKNGKFKEEETMSDTTSQYIDKTIDVTTISEKPYLDILGYTMNTASKMISYADPDSIVLGEEIYNKLSLETRSEFQKIRTNPETWNYVNCSTGKVYKIYGMMEKKHVLW